MEASTLGGSEKQASWCDPRNLRERGAFERGKSLSHIGAVVDGLPLHFDPGMALDGAAGICSAHADLELAGDTPSPEEPEQAEGARQAICPPR